MIEYVFGDDHVVVYRGFLLSTCWDESTQPAKIGQENYGASFRIEDL